MLDGEDEHETVSEEDFELHSVDSQTGKEKPKLSIAELLRDQALRQRVQAELEAKRNAVPDRIKLISDERNWPLRDMLKALWKDKCRLLTLNHMLAECDCSGDQVVEASLLADFETAHAKFQIAEEKRKLANIARLKEIRAAKRLEEMSSDYSGSDEADEDEDSSDFLDSDSGSEVPGTARNSTVTGSSSMANSEADKVGGGGGESKQKNGGGEGEDRKDEDEDERAGRDSDDDAEPPPDLVPITLAFVNSILLGKQQLEGVQFDDNPLGASGLGKLCDALQTCPRITMLNLSSVQAGTEGARHLADALRGSSLQRTMEHLVFGHNNIGPDGCKVIAEAVGRRCRKMQTLRLHANKIKSDGAVSLSKELFTHASLAVLDIGNNDIGDRGCEMLSEYVAENTALRRLNLNNNLFTVRGGRAMGRTLMELRQIPIGSRLERLSILRCRRLDSIGIRELRDAAEAIGDGFTLFSDKI